MVPRSFFLFLLALETLPFKKKFVVLFVLWVGGREGGTPIPLKLR